MKPSKYIIMFIFFIISIYLYGCSPQKVNINFYTPPENPTRHTDNEYQYTFKGWEPKITKVTNDQTYTATYTQTAIYTITFHNQYHDVINTQRILSATKVELVTIDISNNLKYDYQFLGWIDENNNSFDFNNPITKSMDLYPNFIKTPQKVELSGLKLSILGDSISTFYDSNSMMNSYYSGENQFYYPLYSQTVKTATNTWWGKLITKADFTLGINNSWSGSMCYNWGNSQNSGAMNEHRINTLGENGTPDIIIVMIGTNDNVNGISNENFTSAYTTMITRILKKYPKSIIFCATMGYANYNQYSFTNTRRLEYNEIIKNVCEKYDLCLIPIDIYQTEFTYQDILGDALHPNLYGMEIYANAIYDSIYSFLSN